MSGRAGAESTQERAPTCISPPALALHPRPNLYGFRVLLNADRAFVLSLFEWLGLEARHRCRSMTLKFAAPWRCKG